MESKQFDRQFIWGCATSAFQIEGGASADGRGESIWDRFSKKPGNVAEGHDGDVACDHYNRYRGDVDLMKELGMKAYRFSISWPRILPDGRGAVNEKGLSFYDELVDALLEREITPWVTLYHWDLPQILEDEGGWPNRKTAYAFAEYTEAVSRRLGDRVKHWITHNEPWCASILGYQTGEHAPGIKDWPKALAASHHLMLSHGLSVGILRRNSPDSLIGITNALMHVQPASGSYEDREAYRHLDGTVNRWFMDPLYRRCYPADIVADHRESGYISREGLSFVYPGDMDLIAAPIDFLGVNYYSRQIARSTAIPESKNAPRDIFALPPDQRTDMGWEVYPDGLTRVLERVHREYRPGQIYVTENGAAYGEKPGADGRVPDSRRCVYLRDHLLAAHSATESGVPLLGYFVWSLLDNFEWAFGYTKRFGIVWVDFETQQRTIKDSAYWYREVIRNNAVSLNGAFNNPNRY